MYNDLRDHISSLLTGGGYIESVDSFDVEHLPDALADKAFSVKLASIEQFGTDTEDRIYPIYNVIVSAIYSVGNNKFSRLDVAHTWNEELIAMVMNPTNRSTDTRVVNYEGSEFTDFDNDGYFVVATNKFKVEMSLLYLTEFSGGLYTDTTFDETIEGGDYADTINNNFEGGSYA
jgi:hypothetical protein